MKRRSSAVGKPAKPRGPKRSTPKRGNAPKAVRDQETQLARLTRERDDALEQLSAASDVARKQSEPQFLCYFHGTNPPLLVDRYKTDTQYPTRQRGSYTGPLSAPFALAVDVKPTTGPLFFDPGQFCCADGCLSQMPQNRDSAKEAVRSLCEEAISTLKGRVGVSFLVCV